MARVKVRLSSRLTFLQGLLSLHNPDKVASAIADQESLRQLAAWSVGAGSAVLYTALQRTFGRHQTTSIIMSDLHLPISYTKYGHQLTDQGVTKLRQLWNYYQGSRGVRTESLRARTPPSGCQPRHKVG